MRILTRADADGLCSAVFLKTMEKIDSIDFVHPKDIQDGVFAVTSDDILVNLPYHPACGMWFDHHASNEEAARNTNFKGKFRAAPSTARVIYEYYNNPALEKFGSLLEQTDKMDSANLEGQDVTNPEDYMLLLFTLDPRSGLGAFKDYFLKLVDWLREKPISEILNLLEVRKKCDKLMNEISAFARFMRGNSKLDGNVIITDLRGKTDIPPGNRFLIFTLFPKGNVQVRIFDGKGGQITVVSLGKSIFNRTCHANLAELCTKYGGGGHEGAAACQIPKEKADAGIADIIRTLKTE